MSRSLITQPRLALASPRALVATSSLVSGSPITSYWTLDETSGNYVDRVGRFALAVTGSPTRGATGKLGAGVTFTADSQFLDLSPADATKYSPGMGSFWVGFWINPATTVGSIASKYSTTQTEWRVFYSSNLFSVLVSNTATATVLCQATSGVTVTAGQWYRVDAWFDAATQKLVISVNNGTPTQTSANAAFASSGIFAGTASLRLGGSTGNSASIRGTLDGFLYANRIPATGERSLVWGNGSGVDYPFFRSAPATARAAA